MRAVDRLAELITTYSIPVIAVMLVLSALLGAGAASLEQSPGLDQFEFETEEGDALEYINEHFDVGRNETGVQVVLRDQENALSRSSFIETLELQRSIRADSDINGTLAEDSFQDLASIVATQGIRAEELQALRAEQAAIENDSAELNETAAALERDAAALEADRAALEERRAALENRTDILRDALGTTVEIQTIHERGELSEAEADAQIAQTWSRAEAEAELDASQNATFEAVGEEVRDVARLEFERGALIETVPAEITDDPGAQATLREALNQTVELQLAYLQADTSAEREDVNASINATWTSAIEEADLDETQAQVFQDAGTDVRDLTTTIQDRGPMAALFEQGTAGVFADELADLEATGEELAARGEALEERRNDLEERSAALEERSEALQADFESLAELDPDLDAQIAQLEAMSDEEVTGIVADLLDEDGPTDLLTFVPRDFETGETETDARTLFITQTTGEEQLVEGEAPDRIVESQLAIADQVDERFGQQGIAFGVGIITDEINRSMSDSLGVVMPFALLFVVVVLVIAYRDILDILLGLFGIGLVLVWTFGFVGWTGITFNQIMIAVPVLLVGLSIDYAIHVFMRHRERRSEADRGSRSAMSVVLLGLGAALVWVTITAVIGFLSNLVSPVAPIRDFGIVSAFGIVATLLIFGVLVPAAKVELDSRLEARGWDRRKRAFGTGGGPLSRVLNVGNVLSDRLPWAVIIVALLLTAGGVYGGMQVDTQFNQEDFIADDPPAWMDNLPGALAPGEYTVKANLDYVNDRFFRQDSTTQILIRGDITADDALERIDAGQRVAAEEAAVVVLPDGSSNVGSPLSSMQSLAGEDAAFNETFHAHDTDGDDIPDQNLTGLYDAYFDAAGEEAASFLAGTGDGEYDAARMTVSIDGAANAEEATDATRAIADEIQDSDVSAIATGQLVVFNIIEGSLFDSVIESLLVTMVVVFAFLMVAYRLVHDSAILGAVTLTPIMLSVAWILGSMWLMEIPFNVITGTITSLTIGLGVAYNIHISERYRLELDNGDAPVEAMGRAVRGTGGALLGSAATTIGGFGVLIFAILPPLQQFGLITALTILYAFLGSVLVLPSFLRIWTAWVRRA